MHNFSTSITPEPRIPRSTTRANCILFSFGGPDSNSGDANGTSSAFVINTPSVGESGKGEPISSFTPTKTSVSPSFTHAEPSALFIISRFRLISRYSRKPLPSSLSPSLSMLRTKSFLTSSIISSPISISPCSYVLLSLKSALSSLLYRPINAVRCNSYIC